MGLKKNNPGCTCCGVGGYYCRLDEVRRYEGRGNTWGTDYIWLTDTDTLGHGDVVHSNYTVDKSGDVYIALTNGRVLKLDGSDGTEIFYSVPITLSAHEKHFTLAPRSGGGVFCATYATISADEYYITALDSAGAIDWRARDGTGTSGSPTIYNEVFDGGCVAADPDGNYCYFWGTYAIDGSNYDWYIERWGEDGTFDSRVKVIDNSSDAGLGHGVNCLRVEASGTLLLARETYVDTQVFERRSADMSSVLDTLTFSGSDVQDIWTFSNGDYAVRRVSGVNWLVELYDEDDVKRWDYSYSTTTSWKSSWGFIEAAAYHNYIHDDSPDKWRVIDSDETEIDSMTGMVTVSTDELIHLQGRGITWH
jgi:hypothetical protein